MKPFRLLLLLAIALAVAFLLASAQQGADAANPPPGCYFHPRCAFATDACREKRPELREIAPGHLVRCHRAEEITLQGIGA